LSPFSSTMSSVSNHTSSASDSASLPSPPPSHIALLFHGIQSISIESISEFFRTVSFDEAAIIVAPVACYWLYSAFFYVLSVLKLTRVELHRIPTNQFIRRPSNPKMSTVLYKVAIQHVLQASLALILTYLTHPPPTQPPRPMESWPMIIIKFIAAALILDTYQYWMHRWMHTNRFLYKHFHSVHHELTAPFAFGALYNHPVEGLLMDTVGSGIAPLLLDMHPRLVLIFFCISTMKTVDDHCGYHFWPWDPFQFFFSNNAAYHDVHHWGKGRMYNFSQPFFIFWDTWCGTEYTAAMKRLADLKKSKLTGPRTTSGDSGIIDASYEDEEDEGVEEEETRHLVNGTKAKSS